MLSSKLREMMIWIECQTASFWSQSGQMLLVPNTNKKKVAQKLRDPQILEVSQIRL
jgi:hypothetical protein